jgi:hypothetical protein
VVFAEAFGGYHAVLSRCVGEHLARAEMRTVLERVLARIPDYRLAGPVALGASMAFNRGPRAVPVVFTPGPAVSPRKRADGVKTQPWRGGPQR